MKDPKCKLCGGPHYKTWCPKAPRKPIKVNKPIEAYRTPIKRKMPITTSKPQKPLKRAKIKLQSTSPRAILMREADKLFSLYIRKRYAVNGYARCVTCNTFDNYKSMDAGHFLSRRYMVVRFHPKNVHVQCQRCNRELGGNLKKYEAFMVDKYGREYVDTLKRMATVGGKLTITDLETIITKYKKYS